MARKSCCGRLQLEQALNHAASVIEAAQEMRERSLAAERGAYELRALAVRATRAANTINASARSCFGLAHKLITEEVFNIILERTDSYSSHRRHNELQKGSLTTVAGDIGHVCVGVYSMCVCDRDCVLFCISRRPQWLKAHPKRAAFYMCRSATNWDICVVLHSINELSAGDTVGFSILQHQAERLLSVITHEAVQSCVDDPEHIQTTGLSDRILRLESRARPVQGVDSPVNSQRSRCDIDERYPDMSSSRESLMDLGNVVSLPPVPEDSLGNFCKLAVRTSSLSSLKNFRKVKLCLQRASSEEDEDSESEEHSFASSDEQGSSDKEMRSALLAQKKNIMLGNIKEEV